MATKRSMREALKLFNEKAALVQRRSFIRGAIQGGAGYSIMGGGGQVVFELQHPDEESVEATVVTCRYFLEPRDGCSFDQLAVMYADPNTPIEQRLRAISTATTTG